MNWLERYREGRRAEVWHELRQLGAGSRDGGLEEEAQSVCDEMAGRARRNVEVIIERLSDAGYRFHTNDDDQETVVPHVPPTAEAPALADWLEEWFGAVPMTLLSWLRIVGDVWLVGTHPEWPTTAAADPLVIEVEGSRYPGPSPSGSINEEFAAWQDWAATDPDAGPFMLPLAPDRFHKANVSGGDPYGMFLPDGCADGLFVGDGTTPFVSYLNSVFRNGGFPRQTGSAAEWRLRNSLAADLLPL
ncbi:hypothetical protein CC117_02635 [Parafrankia colletiae]|uniref:Uncharacterized protein n=1 Tax=Parafrankia colletiae TaxID=573497 RepID=A0A1S1R0W3_9ACTN|nr:hypothetical protein CC117_02635 [Parafrankia colletiae]